MNTSNHTSYPSPKRGFTLVEIMIVVAIIGILAAMAGVAFKKTRDRSIATRVANDLRVFADAFQTYSLENGAYPNDVGPATVPTGMAEYIKPGLFTSETPAGGRYDWDEGVFGITAAVSLMNPTVDNSVLLEVDKIIDDGGASTGYVKIMSGRLLYIIEG